MFLRRIPSDRELPASFEALKGFLTIFGDEDPGMARKEPSRLLAKLDRLLSNEEIADVLVDCRSVLALPEFPAVEVSGSSNLVFPSELAAKQWFVKLTDALQRHLQNRDPEALIESDRIYGEQ